MELIIALTILTLITVVIGSGLRLGINAWNKGELETEETQRLRILSTMLSQQLKSVYPHVVNIDNENLILFKGEEDSLLFVTTSVDRLYGGLKWIRYSYKDGTLFYKEGLLPDKDLIDNIEGDEEILDTDIEKIKFEYYIAHTGEWQESWDFGDTMPQAVRIAVSYFQPFQVNLKYGKRIMSDESEIEEIL